ncbi:MAG TPA: PSP1 C-terminal domain-containing protein [Gemmataceae bacterium]|nr:PSP1 C-terminal domain-containing protein [Gemmataceae bacterium]
MSDRGYLLSYGRVGDFGRFESAEPFRCRRGDRVVVRSARGQEIGVVMRAVSEGHALLLADRPIGQMMRLATPGDEELSERMHARSQRLFTDARRDATELNLPLEILDAEILLDGRRAILHYVSWADGDFRLLLDRLSGDYQLLPILNNLALPVADEPDDVEMGGCGAEGCGHGAGGCGSCGSGGCGSCGSHEEKSTSRRAAQVTNSLQDADVIANQISYTQPEDENRVSLL